MHNNSHVLSLSTMWLMNYVIRKEPILTKDGNRKGTKGTFNRISISNLSLGYHERGKSYLLNQFSSNHQRKGSPSIFTLRIWSPKGGGTPKSKIKWSFDNKQHISTLQSILVMLTKKLPKKFKQFHCTFIYVLTPGTGGQSVFHHQLQVASSSEWIIANE